MNAFRSSQLYDNAPIQTDYWADSVDKKVSIVVRKDGSKVLFKNMEEHTSAIRKCYKCAGGDALIVVTEYSIYVVDGNTPVRRMQMEADEIQDQKRKRSD